MSNNSVRHFALMLEIVAARITPTRASARASSSLEIEHPLQTMVIAEDHCDRPMGLSRNRELASSHPTGSDARQNLAKKMLTHRIAG